jgi:hypothetical protein
MSLLWYADIVVLAGELAVPCNLQAALAGVNSSPRLDLCEVWSICSVLKVGSCAIRSFEPCQIRKEAALRKKSYVP